MKPINGSVIASQNFAIIMIVDASVIAMPFFVMYASITQDIILTPPPSIRPPMPYASFSLKGTLSASAIGSSVTFLVFSFFTMRLKKEYYKNHITIRMSA